MKIIKDPKQMYDYSLKMKCRGKTVGLVPTMGYLHEGHLSLIEAAKKQANVVVVSIFVNPTQFGPNEDLDRYPRNLRKDKKLLRALGVDALFLPSVEKMYDKDHLTYVEVPELSKRLCGRTRPSHFRGVATIVAKLFSVILPDFAYFGEKDYQQQVIIRKMARDLSLAVRIVSLPTIREFDGLAKSSRNEYLTAQERKEAAILYRSLSAIKEEIGKGEADANKLLMRLRSMLGRVPHLRIDYVAIVDPATLTDVKKIKGQVLVALAVFLGKARLIDNVLAKPR